MKKHKLRDNILAFQNEVSFNDKENTNNLHYLKRLGEIFIIRTANFRIEEFQLGFYVPSDRSRMA